MRALFYCGVCTVCGTGGDDELLGEYVGEIMPLLQWQ
jgi:hypothetical protein